MLDAPAAKLTHEQVEKEFSGEIKLSEQKLTAIMKYYNGRFDLLNCILKEFAEQNENMNSVIYIKHDIPAECNSFVDICNMTATIEVKTV